MASITRARTEDWQQLRDVRLAALAADPSAFGSSLERELAFTRDRWQSWPEKQACFLAHVGDETVGMATGKTLPDGEAGELNALWVHPEHRAAGIGATLILSVVDWAKEAGFLRLELWVTSGNAAAMQVYESNGFLRTGKEKPLPSDPQLTEVQYSRALA